MKEKEKMDTMIASGRCKRLLILLLIYVKVGPNDSADVRTWIVPRRLGEIELDVEASAGRLMDRVIRKLLVEVSSPPSIHTHTAA